MMKMQGYNFLSVLQEFYQQLEREDSLQQRKLYQYNIIYHQTTKKK